MSSHIMNLVKPNWLYMSAAGLLLAYGIYSMLTGTDSVAPRLVVIGEDNRIEIIEATYGASCNSTHRVQFGNVSNRLKRACNGLESCKYQISVHKLGDPAGGCQKDFKIYWRCRPEHSSRHINISPEAHGKHINISCKKPSPV